MWQNFSKQQGLNSKGVTVLKRRPKIRLAQTSTYLSAATIALDKENRILLLDKKKH